MARGGRHEHDGAAIIANRMAAIQNQACAHAGARSASAGRGWRAHVRAPRRPAPRCGGPQAGAPKHDLAADLQLGALERLDLAVVDKRPVCGVEVGDRHLVAALCAVPRALSTRSLQNAVAQASTRGGREAPWLLRTHGLPADTQPPLPGPPRSPRPDAARLKQRRGAHRPAAWRAGWTQWGPAR